MKEKFSLIKSKFDLIILDVSFIFIIVFVVSALIFSLLKDTYKRCLKED